MYVKTYGTRGSIPISNRDSIKFGGNTTSLQILSNCIPSGNALVVDAGSGYVPLCRDLLSVGVMRVNVVFTHYHHDHTQGVVLAPHTFIPSAHMDIWGPKEHATGPQEVLATIMQQPFFPVEYAMVRHRFNCHSMENIGTQVLAVHPKGGFLLLRVYVFEQAESDNKQLAFGNGRYPIGECLVIRMYKTKHPEYTVSYRFEERPTGRIFVFLTDHENTVAFPGDLLKHLTGAHLLIQDAQYSEERYRKQAAGFGHGTPEYCVDTAIAAGIGRLGLTHHDPYASDQNVAERLEDAFRRAESTGLFSDLFACADYQTIEV